MPTQQPLDDEQERLRIEGLRALARIIARRALSPARLPDGRRPDQRADGTQHQRAARGERPPRDRSA